MSDNRAAKLRELLAGPDLIVAPGSFNALSAMLVQDAGFQCVYVTGGGTAMSLGLPPLGLHTMSEMVENVRRIATAVDIPVISDVDTGYGGPLHVRRTIEAFEQAGAAAIHIEDQAFPSKSGHMAGKQLIRADEMVQKIRAACDARSSRDFVVIARCDALAVEGMKATVERAKRYADAGADALFIESPSTPQEIEDVAREFSLPLVFNMASTGKTPFLSTSEVAAMGYKIMIFPLFTLLAGLKAMRTVLETIREEGSVVPAQDLFLSQQDLYALLRLPAYQDLERRYEFPEEARSEIWKG
jgi:2,3-dimethylmalate lyase